MSSKLIISQLLVLFILRTSYSASVGCYFASWTIGGGLGPEIFDASLCTHVYYAFIGIWDNGNLRVLDDNNELPPGGYYRRVIAMKNRNPNLKVLLSVGGATGGTADLFAGMASNSGKRGAFIGSATYFLQTYGFDGLDIDWEYPTAADRGNYVTLLRETKAAFQSKGWLLTAAVAANPTDGYDIGAMNAYLDIINIMTYDFYGPWSSYTGQNSALFASSIESDWEKSNLNLQACSSNWLNAGLQRQKMVIGTAFYGRTFRLRNPNQHGLHAPISGAGQDSGAPTYLQICTNYNSWTFIWDDVQKNPYKYTGNQWCGYDDKNSIWAKGDWVKRQGFNGAMAWAITYDDVKGQCGESQILLKQLNRAIH